MSRAPKPSAPDPKSPHPTVNTTERQAPKPTTPAPRRTTSVPAGGDQPKLPHERDESVDMTHGAPDARMEQAHRDVERGLQDTDRGPPTDKAYQKQKQ